MKITVSGTPINQVEADCLIVPVFATDTLEALASLNQATGGQVAALFESGDLPCKGEQTIFLYRPGALKAKRLLFYGAGKAEALDALKLQRLAGAAIRALAASPVRSAALLLTARLADAASVKALVEGALLGAMRANLYHTKDEEPPGVEQLTLVCQDSKADADAVALEDAVATAQVMAEAANLARRLGFEPGNEMTPTRLAQRATEMCEREGLAIEVFDESRMKQMGMGALLAVSRGSEEPAQLIIMRYEPAAAPASPTTDAAGKAPPLVALVGKGITFDSGGISIKPAQAMEEMKYDMGGGAAVIGAMQIIARLKPAIRVLGLVAASENLPSGRAYKPGDVIRSMSGKTIEVINTDAEGRVVLADALAYAVNQGATEIVDAATLTGACVVALGETRAGLMGTDQQLIDALREAGEQCGERLWHLPLDSEYAGLVKSDIADVKNSAGRAAGAISAAMFLKNFVGTVPWAHLDIAGTAWFESEKPYLAKGATGFGARLLATYVMNRVKGVRE